MASDDIWILGINMTKFGKHPDKDTVDLASQAAMAALADGGVTMADMGVLAAGCLMGGGGIAQQIQKQIGQTGIPVFNVSNACATGATAFRTVYLSIKAGEADLGLAVGVEQMGKMGLLGAAGAAKGAKTEYVPQGRQGNVMSTEGILGTGTMPGVLAQAGMEYAYKHDGVTVDLLHQVLYDLKAVEALDVVRRQRQHLRGG